MNNLIFLQSQVVEGSQFIPLGLVVGGLIILAPIISAKKGRNNLAVYLITSFFILAASVMSIIGGINGNKDMIIAPAVIGVIVAIFQLVFIFKWSKE